MTVQGSLCKFTFCSSMWQAFVFTFSSLKMNSNIWVFSASPSSDFHVIGKISATPVLNVKINIVEKFHNHYWLSEIPITRFNLTFTFIFLNFISQLKMMNLLGNEIYINQKNHSCRCMINVKTTEATIFIVSCLF